MFSLILPPFVILLALGGIMYLYFRKLPEVEAQLRNDSNTSVPASSATGHRVRRLSLSLVEWFARWFKSLSLRLYRLLHAIALKAHEAKERAAKRVPIGKFPSALPGKQEASDLSLEQKSHFPAPGSSDKPVTERGVSSDSEAPSNLEVREHDQQIQESLTFPESTRKHERSEESSSASRTHMIDPTFSREWPREDVSEPVADAVSSLPSRSVRARRAIGDAMQRLSPRRAASPREEGMESKVPVADDASAKNQLEEILIERISMNPRDIEAYERLGDYYLEQDNLTDAKECYRQVLKLSPAYRLVKIKIRRLERLLEKR